MSRPTPTGKRCRAPAATWPAPTAPAAPVGPNSQLQAVSTPPVGVLPRPAVTVHGDLRGSDGPTEHSHRHHRQRRRLLDASGAARDSPRRAGAAVPAIRIYRLERRAERTPRDGGDA